MGTTLRDVLDWFVDLTDSFLRTAGSGFDKLFDLQILDITFAEWLIFGVFGFIIIGAIKYWGSRGGRRWKGKRTR